MSLREQLARPVVAALMLIGSVPRLLPLLDPAGRGLQQWVTEDGYLMLTIARNIAIGNGMSVSDGTVATNGTQPLATLVWSALFWLADGDKVVGVNLVQALSVGIALLATALLYQLAQLVLEDTPRGDELAGFAAALWYAAPLTTRHGANGLESGLYVLVLLWLARSALRGPLRTDAAWSPRQAIVLGGLLALCFWARNDGVWIALAFCAVHALPGLRAGGAELRRRIQATGIAGTTALVGVSPWLIFNQLRFGSIVPISGIAESSSASFGGNLIALPAPLFEYLAVVVPIPRRFEEQGFVLALAMAGIVAAIVAIARFSRGWSAPAQRLAAVVAIYGAGLCAFYALWFGAPHFMSRYLFPLGVFCVVAGVGAAGQALDSRPSLRAAVAAACVTLVLGAQIWMWGGEAEHRHFAVVEWVEANVPDEVWVGGVQTGTLGFFHDRTLNLDGKVDPAALEARLAGRTQEYVLETPIQYLADWPGIESWLEGTALESKFELVELDPKARLAVLGRHGRPGP